MNENCAEGPYENPPEVFKIEKVNVIAINPDEYDTPDGYYASILQGRQLL